MVNLPDPPEFSTENDAWDWLVEQIDNDPFADNFRIAYEGDEEAQEKYDRIQEEGCCGSIDRDVVIAGQKATIGCNYGH